MLTDFSSILSLAPKAKYSTFTDVAKANANAYPEALREAQQMLVSAATQKQNFALNKEKLALDRRRVDADIKVINSNAKQDKKAAALALLPAILEGFTKKRRDPDRFAGDFLAAAFQGNDIDALAGFGDLTEQLNRVRGAITPWNSLPGFLETKQS